MRPYHPSSAPFNWLGWWDFGTGALGDMGYHYFDSVYHALKPNSPTAVEAVSTRVNKESYPLGSVVTFHFPARGEMPPAKVQWHDGGLQPPRPEALKEGNVMAANGVIVVGDDGMILTDWDSLWRMFPEERAIISSSAAQACWSGNWNLSFPSPPTPACFFMKETSQTVI